MIRALQSGLRSLIRRDAVSRELDDELRHYHEQLAMEKMRAGHTRGEAERAAWIEVGGLEATKERVRASGWEAPVDRLWQDVRYAARALRRHPGFTLVALITLALGTGATTAMFSVINTVVLRPLPYSESDRLLLVWTDDVRRNLRQEPTSYRTIMDWKQRNQVFQDVAFYNRGRVSPISNDPTVGRNRAIHALVSGNLFDVLGVAPERGRLITAADEAVSAEVMVISHAFWQRWFGGAPDVIGRTVTFDDNAKGGIRSFTVVGVMPADFFFPDRVTELWTPATTYWRFSREADERFEGWARRWTAVGRLKPGASIEDARLNLSAIGRDLALTHPTSVPEFPGFAPTVMPMLDSIAGRGLQSALWLLLGATVLVLLIACANVANLLLARGATRQSEFAIRRALGGGRVRLLRLLAVENLLLAIVGGMAGVLISGWATRLLATAAAGWLPRIDQVSIDAQVLLFALAIALVSSLVFGLIPAFRLSAIDAIDTLKEGGRGSSSSRLRGARGLIVLTECSLAIVLLAGAALLLRSLDRVAAVDPGWDPDAVLAMRVEFSPMQSDPGNAAGARVREQQNAELLARLRSLPGVAQAGFVDDLFVTGQGNEVITIPGRAVEEIPAGELNGATVSPGFFEALRVPLRRGRYPDRGDAARKIHAMFNLVLDGSLAERERRATAEPVIVNEAFVRRFFPNEDPIGRKFCFDPLTKTYWFEIVGVVGDMQRGGPERAAIPEFFGPLFPNPGARVDLLVRAESDAAALALAPIVRQEILRAFPGSFIANVSTADQLLGGFSAQRRLQTALLTSFALLALALAAIGIFGLVHYAVAERTREIGVRVALGASPDAVLSMVMRQGMLMPAAGVGAGIVASLLLTRVISSQLFGVTATDPVTYAAVALLLGCVAAVACYSAARRALQVDPMHALRQG